MGTQERAPRCELLVAAGRGHGHWRGRHAGNATPIVVDPATIQARAESRTGPRRLGAARARAPTATIRAMTQLDVEALRRRFPALSIAHGDGPIVFLDGPGGTQVPDVVIEAMADYLRAANANHGGAFATSRRSDAIVTEAHAAVADLFGVDSDEVTLGANMTTLTFQFSRSIAAGLEPGDEIIVTGLDHAANVDPWLAAAADRGLVVRWWEPRLSDCTLDAADLEALLSPRTRVLAIGWASNAVGTINPVAEAAAAAHRVGALVYVDAVAAAPHLVLDARAVGADFVAASVYKFFGPHVGAIFGRRAVRNTLRAYKVRPADDRFETGTGNFEGYAGTLAAIGYLEDVGRMAGAPEGSTRRERLVAAMRAIGAVETRLYRRLHDGLAAIPGVTLYGITDPAQFQRRTPTAAFTVAGLGSDAVARRLGDEGIAVWDGNFYALGLVERLGLEGLGGLIRVGLTHYNTAGEVDRLLEAIGRIAVGGAGQGAFGPGAGTATAPEPGYAAAR
ncbi:MAG: cysteine desulfurase family protein [Chloroflexi bacterium]|nr:cysteine desulfurase family protein [Chloroflexota bacterium]